MSDSSYWVSIGYVLREVTNITSLISSILTFLLILLLRHYRPYIFNRVSLRFQSFIAVIDLIRHTILLSIEQPESSGLCVALSFFGFYFDHLYILVNSIIALNLQLIFFQNIRPDKRVEILLLGVGILAVAILDSVPFIYEFYGRSARGGCFISINAEHRVLFRVVLLYVFQLTGMMYCLCVFISVFLYLYYRKKQIEMKFPDKTIILFGEKVNARAFIQKLYRRIAFYPMASVVCLFPYIVSWLYTDINGINSARIDYAASYGLCFAGTANLIALMFDPHFQFAIRDIIRKGLNYSHVSKTELRADVDFCMVEELKQDHECLVEFPGYENIEFRDFIIFI